MKKYLAALICLVLINTTQVRAQNDLVSTTHETNISFPTQTPSDNHINYSFERNQFKLSLDPSADYNFNNLKINSIFDKPTKSTFLTLNQDDIFFAWQLNQVFAVNFNVFENPSSYETLDHMSNYKSNQLPFNKSLTPTNSSSTNRNLTGYKLGVSSVLGFGNNYKLGLNLDIGQLEGADLLGFNQEEINTTSFALGIRKSQFGASINTDIFLEDLEANLEQSRLGFELDWYFSKSGKLSFGTKKTMRDTSSIHMNNIDDITGNVQYIKFQHNL